jgi:hypothetical protein
VLQRQRFLTRTQAQEISVQGDRGGMLLRNFVAQSVKTAGVTSQKTVVFGVKQSVGDCLKQSVGDCLNEVL